VVLFCRCAGFLRRVQIGTVRDLEIVDSEEVDVLIVLVLCYGFVLSCSVFCFN
jgi:hypothetical protein